MTYARCSTCRSVLLHVTGALRCCNPHCTTGHQDLAAQLPVAVAASAKPAAAASKAAGERARFFGVTFERSPRILRARKGANFRPFTAYSTETQRRDSL